MRKGFITVVALLTAGLAAGCGGVSSKTDPPATGSSAAHRLLVQTFDGHHTITSGVISLEVNVTPSGSATAKSPFELTFGGPFTRAGAGKAPESDFTVAISDQGHHGSLQVISAGGKGYITVSGQSYQLPASNFKSVQSGLGSLTHTGGAAGGKSATSMFGKLGIQPLDWLSNPQIVGGSSTVGGVATTHVHATVDAAAMLQDFSKALGKAGSLGVSGASSLPKSISASTQTRIAKALGSPTLDVWTGKSDKIIRNLTVHATIPITGQSRARLGGVTSESVTLIFSYSDVNQPQTITAPSSVQPYSVFRSKVAAVLQEIESTLLSGSLTGTTTTGSGTLQPNVGSIADRKYTNCISSAAGDVKKMQRCASLLGSALSTASG